MGPQALTGAVNEYLKVSLPIVAALVAGCGLGVVLGRFSRWKFARRQTQLALERAARDIRKFNNLGFGVRFGSHASKQLTEAEYICIFRSRGDNYLLPPTGETRMRPEGVPRSKHRRQERERHMLRSQILAFAQQDRDPNDTGVVDLRTRTNRRYR